MCPVGVNCVFPGVTLRTLPLKRGYFRASDVTIDVRRCVDAAANCSGTTECEESSSGCAGGQHLETTCMPGLGGIFCTKCLNGSSNIYYSAATKGQDASCEECTGSLGPVFLLGLAATMAVVLVLLTCIPIWRQCVSVRTKRRIKSARSKIHLNVVQSWFKILVR